MAEPHCFEATLVENRPLGGHSFLLRLDGCAALADARPGQFVMLRGTEWGTDPLLPRAFSLLAVREGGKADLLVKAVGKATARLERAAAGSRLQVLGPLGNWFPEPSNERADWLVAGGVGLAPLLMQAVRAHALGHTADLVVFYGGRSRSDLVLVEELEATRAVVQLATEDGSVGERGYVTDALVRALDARAEDAARGSGAPTLLCCGPEPMLRAVARLAHQRDLDAYLSLEGEMACGLGACLACAVPSTSRPFRYACSDGPVFRLSELSGPYAPAGEKGGAQ
jgi:dihydroorotate dehydrogenase electron transfer subunit